MEWYWWVGIIVVIAISIPFKVKFMKWWGQRQKEKRNQSNGKWGNNE